MMNSLLPLIIFILLQPAFSHGQVTALANGTIIDLCQFGQRDNDQTNSLVLFEDDKITYVGVKNAQAIPPDAKVYDISGKFIMPGLIDGYGTINNQSYANAYLYLGVTSVVGVSSKRRGQLYLGSKSGPTIIPWASLPEFGADYPKRVLSEKIPKMLKVFKDKKIKILQLMYPLEPAQLELAINFCAENNISTLGELGNTSVKTAISRNISALIHSQRYIFDLAPANLRQKILADPFGPDMNDYNNWLIQLDLNDQAFANLSWFFGESQIALMPTLSLYGSFLSDTGNPWQHKAASIINPEDIHMPVNRSTGMPEVSLPETVLRKKLVNKLLKIENSFYKSGARYLAGSGTDVFGTMPGISLHREIELLAKAGLSHREAIAAATSNFSEIFKWDIGKISPGNIADILILNKNPLQDLKNLEDIHLLFAKGKKINREKLLQK